MLYNTDVPGCIAGWTPPGTYKITQRTRLPQNIRTLRSPVRQSVMHPRQVPHQERLADGLPTDHGKPRTLATTTRPDSVSLFQQNSPTPCFAYELPHDTTTTVLETSHARNDPQELLVKVPGDESEPLVSPGSDDHPTLNGVAASHQDNGPVDPNIEYSRHERKRRLQGWRFGIACVTVMTWAVFLTNTVLAIVAATNKNFPKEDGIVTVYEGSCVKVDWWLKGVHVIINVLSSALLAASNYTMQFLAAPTRDEVKAAHGRGDWLDIGVPSARNMLGRISKRRTLLWLLLCLSSLPIHLVFNSAVFKMTEVSAYTVSMVAPRFFDTKPPNDPHAPEFEAYPDIDIEAYRSWPSSVESDSPIRPEVLPRARCRAIYRKPLLSGHADLLLVSKELGNQQHDSQIRHVANAAYVYGLDAYGQNFMDMTKLPAAFYGTTNRSESYLGEWRVFDLQVDYCIALKVPEQCSIQTSMHILTVVVLCNLIKGMAMSCALLCQRHNMLVTVGDSIASFLQSPDKSTTTIRTVCPTGALTRPRAILDCKWFAFAPKAHWCIFLGFGLSGILSSLGLLIWGVQASKWSRNGESIRSPFTRGFGDLDPKATIHVEDWNAMHDDSSMYSSMYSPAGELIKAVLLANTPQIVCSLAYYMINGLLTYLAAGREWSRYYLRKKPLRVSDPRGSQRSTYFLSLPYRYSLPLIVSSSLLHWTICRGCSLTAYSALPILCVVLGGFTIYICVIAIGFRNISGHMPIAGSRSDMISAACHRSEDDVHAAFKPVSWGELAHGTGSAADGCRCAFTSERVYEPCAVRRTIDADEHVESLDAQSL